MMVAFELCSRSLAAGIYLHIFNKSTLVHRSIIFKIYKYLQCFICICTQGRLEYLVQWVGYSLAESSWVHEKYLTQSAIE